MNTNTHSAVLDPIDVHEAIKAAHLAAYTSVSLFGEHHRFKDGSRFCEPESTVVDTGKVFTHGIFNNTLDFIPLSKILVDGKLTTQCKSAMGQVSVADIRQLVKQNFTKNKDWRIGDVRVSVNAFLEPILQFLDQHDEEMEAFAGIYDNKLMYSDVLGLVIVSKQSVIGQRMTWEITIDDADLVPPLSVRGLFGRK